MHKKESWVLQLQKNTQASLIGHGALIIFVSLIAGIMLTFDMLNGFKLWPFIDMDVNIPGTVRGWRVAHSGGLLNGVMIIGMALCLSKVDMKPATLRFVYWSFLCTGWGNIVFYWAGNFAMNRGLSVGATPYGEGDIYGAIAYLSGASVLLFTVAASFMVAKCAFNSSKSYT